MSVHSGWPEPPSKTPNGAAAWTKPAATVGNKASPPPPPAKPMARLRLQNLSDIAKEYRKLYREARAGTLSTAEASKLGYLLNMLAGLLTASDLEDRLATLESDKVKR